MGDEKREDRIHTRIQQSPDSLSHLCVWYMDNIFTDASKIFRHIHYFSECQAFCYILHDPASTQTTLFLHILFSLYYDEFLVACIFEHRFRGFRRQTQRQKTMRCGSKRDNIMWGIVKMALLRQRECMDINYCQIKFKYELYLK